MDINEPALMRAGHQISALQDEVRGLRVELEEARAENAAMITLANDAYEAWDADFCSRVGKLLRAMCEPKFRAMYRPDLAALSGGEG